VSRTQRKFMSNGNRREARGGRFYVIRSSPQPIGTEMVVHLREPKVPWGKRRHRGGMLMTSRSTGLWSDEMTWKPSQAKGRTKRAIKRRERQQVRQEMDDMLNEMYEPDVEDESWEQMSARDYFEALLPGSLDELYDEAFFHTDAWFYAGHLPYDPLDADPAYY
jgi:hypothetical protein